jgi:hypothetical protein
VNETSIERTEQSEPNQLDEPTRVTHVPRRAFLKLGAVGAAAVAVGTTSSLIVPELRRKGLLSANGVFEASSQALAALVYTEVFPISPLILNPFTDEFVKPKAASPVPYSAWSNDWTYKPGPGIGQQNSYGDTGDPEDNNTHQRWKGYDTDPDIPIVYQIKAEVDTHSFTTSMVLPIDKNGRPTKSFDASGKVYPAGTKRQLPDSTIYGFNGGGGASFPGPMINAEYGKPVIVRFENHLDENVKQRPHGARERRQPALGDDERPAPPRVQDQGLGGPAVSQLAGRQRRCREAVVLLVPRPPYGSHRLERVQGHGRPVPDLRPEDRSVGRPQRRIGHG